MMISVGLKIPKGEYYKWFESLWSGTTSHKKQRLFAKNDKYSLIRIVHHGHGGYTEWNVIENIKPKGNWGIPDAELKIEGRLTKEAKMQIYIQYKLEYGKIL